jgi:hypothetical protein
LGPIPSKERETDESRSFDPVKYQARGAALKEAGEWTGGTMTHADDRILEEMNERDRLERLRRILEILESDNRPHFDFYAHEHPEGGEQFHVRG